MIKYCLEKWDKNKDRLQHALAMDESLDDCDYMYLVKMYVNYILNDVQKASEIEEEECYLWVEPEWNVEKIVEIVGSGYSGDNIYVIPKYRACCAEEYLFVKVDYGSCSHCDTLSGIQRFHQEPTRPDGVQLTDYMTLCRDMMTHTIRPFCSDYEDDDTFEEVKVNWITDEYYEAIE